MKLIIGIAIVIVGAGLLTLAQTSKNRETLPVTDIVIPLERDEGEVLPDPQASLVQQPGEFSGQDQGVGNLQNAASFSPEELNTLVFPEE